MPNDQMSTSEPATRADWIEEAEELPPRPRRRLLAPIPIALLAVLLLACGFIGGVLVEKGQTGSSQSSSGTGLAARFAGSGTAVRAAGAGGAGSSSGAGSPFASRGTAGGRAGQITTGQVTYVEGSTLYVEGLEGNTVKVRTSAGSTVTKTQTSSVKSIHPGESVLIQGTASSGSATVTARSISVGAGAGAGAGGLGGLRGLLSGSSGRGGGATTRSSGAGEPALFGK